MNRKLSLIVPFLAAALVAGCGSDYERASAQSDANALLRETVANLGEMRSATVDLKARIDGEGAARVRGAFAIEEDGRLPRFALTGTAQSGGRSQSAGATWTGEKGYVTLAGTPYEVSGLVSGQVVAGYEEAAKKGNGVLGAIDFSRWLRAPRNEGMAQIGDAETVRISGTADAARVTADVEALMGRMAVLNLPGLGPSHRATPRERQRAADAIKSLDVTVYTGASDRILRRLVVAGPVKGEAVLLDVTFTRVGEDQTIEAPKGARPFGELLKRMR